MNAGEPTLPGSPSQAPDNLNFWSVPPGREAPFFTSGGQVSVDGLDFNGRLIGI